MMMVEFLALFFCGTFFGAAVYISIAQHPASMRAGIPVAAQFFPPMYRFAAPMQIVSAIIGSLAGTLQWFLSGNIWWAIGALLLIFVIPYTLIALKPINDQLLNGDTQRSEANLKNLLDQWALHHWVRSITSALSFTVYLWTSISA